ncbi:MAG: hypothetical protein QGH37_23505 [Candidatus Poribacteria bacterium]|nr:hypothetical protein [Candidatus Poribacteria bacterium]
MVDLPVHLRGNHLTKVDTATPRGFLRVIDHLVKPLRPPEKSKRSTRIGRLADRCQPSTDCTGHGESHLAMAFWDWYC